MKHVIFTISIVFGLFYILSMYSYSFPINGVVRDYATGEPIEGAIVIANRRTKTALLHGSSSSCTMLETIITDKNGQYHINGWVKKKGHFTKVSFDIYPFKIGYEEYRGKLVKTNEIHNIRVWKENNSKLYLQKYKGEKAERFSSLELRSFRFCDRPMKIENDEVLIFLQKSLYTEALSLVTDEEKERGVLEKIQLNYEKEKYGEEIASKKYNDRYKKRMLAYKKRTAKPPQSGSSRNWSGQQVGPGNSIRVR